MHHRRLRRILIAILGFGLAACGEARAANYAYSTLPDPFRTLEPLELWTGGNGLPRGWRFHGVSPTGDFPTGRSTYTVSIDPDSGTVMESYREGDVEVREPLVISRDEYTAILTQRNVRKLWVDKSKGTRSVSRGQVRTGGPFRLELPVQLPKVLRSIVGDGAPNIEVSGSETITLAGVSDWTVGGIQTERRTQSAFPSLEMKQELNVNLTGAIGDKIKVDIDQSSNVATSLDNKVKLRFEGDEDDMIRAVDLGNTNLSVEGASFRQEGLFGIKTIMKLGNVDLVAIASKQEGKTETARFTPSGDKRREIIRDLDYIPRTYFFLADHPIKIDRASIRVFKDDLLPAANTASELKGIARVDPLATYDSTAIPQPNPQRKGNFAQLEPGVDYTIITPWLLDDSQGLEIPVLKLAQRLSPSDVLAVSYVDISDPANPVKVGLSGDDYYVEDSRLQKPEEFYLLKVLKAGSDDLLPDSLTGLYDVNSPWYPVLAYELRNFYDMRGRDIALETLDLWVRRINLGDTVDPDAVDGTPLVEILGLDQQSRPGAADADSPDGEVDDQYIDPVTGIVFFPDLHPFDPSTDPATGCAPGRSGFLCLDDYGRNILRRDSQNFRSESNPAPYYRDTIDPATDTRFYIEAQYKSAQQGFFLGRFDILEESEQVKVDGIPKQRGSDYTIDYQTGQLTFIRPPGPDQTVSVDYSFAPGVGSSQLTLMGGSASYVPSPNFSVTSSVLYDSRGAQETNPKLGEEPAKTVIADLATIMTFRPVWMTQLANVVPGVRTSAPSYLNIQGSAATSMPNPNTAGEAYIDDMEGNRESNTIGLTRTSWFWSGVPLTDTANDSLAPVTEVAVHSQLQWYNARTAQEVDLKPVLTEEEGADNEHQVLELNVLPPTGQTTINPNNWTGLTNSLSTVGQDFSRLKYLELWVNDFTPDHTQTNAMLHINFGRVSEDAFWDPDSVPNGVLDSEDKNFDTRLDFDEDTGLDGLFSTQEPGYDGSINPDPNQDDYFFDDDEPADTKYTKINGMEKNGQGLVGARPDTEDLNRDGYPDFANDYFEMTLNLADPSLVAIDVARDYAGDPDVEADNGWRLFRIPISDSLWTRVGQASWQNIKHMRFWVNGMTEPKKIQIGGIELVGNRWLAQPVDSAQEARNVSLIVGVRNNKDDADIYTSPYDVENTVGGTSTRREQSLALHYEGLSPSDSVLAFKAGVIDANTGLGWTQYGEIRFWAHGPPEVVAQNLRVFARFGADTVNYYEYSAPLRSGWQNIIIPMERLSGLKDTSVRVDSMTAAATGEIYTVAGNPSFTRIVRLSFGVMVPPGAPPDTVSGEVWIDDLRLSDVSRDQGVRGTVTMQANFADVMALNVTYQNEDADFFRVGTGLNRGTGINRVQTALSTTFNIDKLFPATGLTLPVRYTTQHSSEVPKFRTGSDVVLTPSRSELETREQNRYSIDSSFRRTGSRKGLAGYTVDALSGNMLYSHSGAVGTQSKDSSWSFTGGLAYNLPVGGGGFGFGRKMKINILPDIVDLSMGWLSSRNLSYSRKILEDTDSTELRSDVKARQMTLDGRGTWTPLSSVTFSYRISSTRNMLLRQEGVFGFNTGTEVDQARVLGLRYTPRWLAMFSPSLTLDGRYNQNSRPELRVSPNDPIGLKNINNLGTARVTLTFPLTRFASRLAPRPGAKGSGTAELLHPVRFVLSRLQDVQGSFNFDRGSTVSRVTGDAGFWFETGFTETVGPELQRAANSVFTARRVYTTGANTSFRPTNNTSIDIRGDHRLNYEDAYLGPRRTLARTLPDVRGRWLDLQRLLGLQSALTSLSLNTAFLKRLEETGPEEGIPDQVSRTTTWGPLLGWDVAWKNGLRANISTTLTEVATADNRVAGIKGDRQATSTDVRFTKIFPASRGIKFPWSKTPVRLPNDLNLNLTLTMQGERKVSTRPGFPDLVEIDIDRLNIASTTNYNFTQAISGGFNLAFRQSKDHKTALTTRGITIALNAQFRF